MSRNAVLADLISAAGGRSVIAARLAHITGSKIDYDRVYQWERRGRVPAAAIPALVVLAKELGRKLGPAEMAALAGPVINRNTAQGTPSPEGLSALPARQAAA